MDLHDDNPLPRSIQRWRSALILMGLIGVLVVGDLLHDASTGAELEHLILEGLLMAAAVGGAWMFFQAWQAERARAAARISAAEAATRVWEEEAQRWRSETEEVLRGLGEAIESQFGRWKLTDAEAEVALLLLKGLSFHEIGDVRQVSERTARKQARSAYAKAGISGRAELSAFFLEDLLSPVRP